MDPPEPPRACVNMQNILQVFSYVLQKGGPVSCQATTLIPPTSSSAIWFIIGAIWVYGCGDCEKDVGHQLLFCVLETCPLIPPPRPVLIFRAAVLWFTSSPSGRSQAPSSCCSSSAAAACRSSPVSTAWARDELEVAQQPSPLDLQSMPHFLD